MMWNLLSHLRWHQISAPDGFLVFFCQWFWAWKGLYCSLIAETVLQCPAILYSIPTHYQLGLLQGIAKYPSQSLRWSINASLVGIKLTVARQCLLSRRVFRFFLVTVSGLLTLYVVLTLAKIAVFCELVCFCTILAFEILAKLLITRLVALLMFLITFFTVSVIGPSIVTLFFLVLGA